MSDIRLLFVMSLFGMSETAPRGTKPYVDVVGFLMRPLSVVSAMLNQSLDKLSAMSGRIQRVFFQN
ncbi:hypothetical protein NS303_13560 [Pantoea ananatis]|uniref:hypothetical protein n=1 Tax=Pantoea ananas TaxID=553 RepID=UPI00048D9432|nr:hypothetical protein [Pantoea ananatis]KTR47895.1 hypothetical protein NS303_13560 [Pantoea ananatis]KTR54531.1 hypothetical protein NS311_16270 [Pantoea ananatis]KTR63974.1 hypothetical protein RSA47_14460 [Pantoea ananatis]KTR70333.1 hypothetical protein NS296_12145 [Pantoea ananatis]MDS7722393.1 hypothetical protein [Pantoea ananatis]